MNSPRIRPIALAVLAALLSLAPIASAAEFGVRAGRYQDGGSNFVGAELLFDSGALNINPNVEYSLEDGVTAGTANVDLTVDVMSIGRFRPYVGAGLGIAYSQVTGRSETDVLGNLIGGVSLSLGTLKPYAQVKYFRTLGENSGAGDNDDIALAIGLRF
jgi:hypothetical protein